MVKLSVEGFPQAVKALWFDVDTKSAGFLTCPTSIFHPWYVDLPRVICAVQWIVQCRSVVCRSTAEPYFDLRRLDLRKNAITRVQLAVSSRVLMFILIYYAIIVGLRTPTMPQELLLLPRMWPTGPFVVVVVVAATPAVFSQSRSGQTSP